MHNAGTLITLTLAAVLVLGCETVPQRSIDEDREATRVARTHMQAGDYLPAAQEYLRLAAASGGDAALVYRLDAASAFVLAKRPDAARQILADFRGQKLSRDLQVRKRLVEAQLALVDERPEEALTLLGTAPPDDAPAELATRYHNVRADALEAGGEHIESARERVQLELLLTDSAALNENRRRIWESLSQLSPQALEAAHIPPPSTLGGWIELAAIGNSIITDPATLGQAMALWRHRYPGHPAGESVVPMLMDDSHFAWAPARAVALLLPFEGQFGKAGEAVRDGFMAAWFADSDSENRPTLIVRDTSSGDIRAIYNRVIEEGADFVVGPLRRTSVTQLADTVSLPVPTLTLNRADAKGPADAEGAIAIPTSGLFQFALSPESEAKLVAEYAWFAGHTNAGVLTPVGAWGDRVSTAFAQAWEDLGGTVVRSESCSTSMRAMPVTVHSSKCSEAISRRRRAGVKTSISCSWRPSPVRRGNCGRSSNFIRHRICLFIPPRTSFRASRIRMPTGISMVSCSETCPGCSTRVRTVRIYAGKLRSCGPIP
jgi:outer membrane PBP1 activator LpoA protein